jgi:hypothetical protein
VSDERSWLTRFVEDFGKLPDHEPPPLIPQRHRIPVFATMVVVSLVLLVLLIWLVVLPAIQEQHRAPRSQSRTCIATART